MNVNELITLFRRNSEESAYTHDRDMPDSLSLWSNYQLINLADQAQKEFAEKTYCFKDGDNFSLTVTEDEETIDLDERILKIERAELDSDNTILQTKTIEEFATGHHTLDYNSVKPSSWKTVTGTPRWLLTDIDSSYIRLYPIPDEDDTITLTVRRLPLYDLSYLEQELEIPTRYQYGLLYKLQAEAYSAPQALMAGFGDAMSLAQAKWDNHVLEATKRFKIKTRGPGVTRYGGI